MDRGDASVLILYLHSLYQLCQLCQLQQVDMNNYEIKMYTINQETHSVNFFSSFYSTDITLLMICSKAKKLILKCLIKPSDPHSFKIGSSNIFSQ